MRIAFFTDDYLPYIHGVTRSIQAYRSALEARGHEVFIVAPKHPDYEDNDDHVLRTNSFNSYVFDKRPISLIYPGMANKFDAYHFDVVHTQTQFWLGTLGYMIARRQGIPHVSTIHTVFPELLSAYPTAIISGLITASIAYPIAYKTKPVLPFDGNFFDNLWSTNDMFERQAWKLLNLFLNHSDLCITPSTHIGNILVKHGLKVRHVVLPNGIDMGFYDRALAPTAVTKRSGEQWIVAVGRLSQEKRQRVLIEALAKLGRSKTRLILVGDGPERAELAALAKRLGVADLVVFTGTQPAAEVAALLGQADLFALASHRFDNQPMVILEALASGLPIVYCDERLTEGLTPRNALLASSSDPGGFAGAFGLLLDDPERMASMSTASRQLASGFDIGGQAAKLEALYLECKGAK